jgi:small subunit ribosomal protein S14
VREYVRFDHFKQLVAWGKHLYQFFMAKKSTIARQLNPKFPTRATNRCFKCGRKRGYMRDFDLCRICFRELANEGKIPGITKSSW